METQTQDLMAAFSHDLFYSKGGVLMDKDGIQSHMGQTFRISGMGARILKLQVALNSFASTGSPCKPF